MTISSVVLEQLLRRLGMGEQSLLQLRIAQALGGPQGGAFPRELLQLSLPVVARGLLNFAVLQMNSAWEYPHWVRRQLDPADPGFTARAQNPLLVNVTHRNWTMVGTLDGRNEAVVDPRGLITPLPREWSVDLWLLADGRLLLPAATDGVRQTAGTSFPTVTTVFGGGGLELATEVFAASTRHGMDVLFASARVRNTTRRSCDGALFVALRPFNPEGVAPVTSVAFRTPRMLDVNGVTGIAFAEAPAWTACASRKDGDLARRIAADGMTVFSSVPRTEAHCEFCLAHAVAGFPFSLADGEDRSVAFSVALHDENALRAAPPSRSWRVDIHRRREREEERWQSELAQGARFNLGDPALQDIFDANRLALLQLCDGDSITPGPWIYHRFWYRDAVPMLRALDLLGFHRRTRTVLDAFPRGMTREGYFRGPDGEWDSNGAVLWALQRHYLLTRSDAWLRRWLPRIRRAAAWIASQRRRCPNGLMPAGLSAEHLGTVDHYYWDAFWSLAGLRSAEDAGRICGDEELRKRCGREAAALERAIREAVAVDPDGGVVAAAPGRAFDESAIGSVCSVYPLDLFRGTWDAPAATVRALRTRFVTDRGFYHPIIHSGFNAYLTMHIAHALLLLGDTAEAWLCADTILRQAGPPFSLPEAVHPRSGGGAMGDGHHGWAAAEIVLFLRDCFVRERGDTLVLLKGATQRMFAEDAGTFMQQAPTEFGDISCAYRRERGRMEITVQRRGGVLQPEAVELHIPLPLRSAVDLSGGPVAVDVCGSGALLRCSPDVGVLLCEL